MSKPIGVVIADDSKETRFNLRRIIEFDSELEVVGEAATGEEAIEQAERLHPDCILMDVNMPGIDGLTATEKIIARQPQTAIIVVSVEGESEYLRRAMAAGARDYLVKPFSPDDLLEAIHRVVERVKKEQNAQMGAQAEEAKERGAKVVTVFSAKGGVGKTTLATNLAVALASSGQLRVALLDFDLQFGDVSIALDITPQFTIADMVKEQGWSRDQAVSYLTSHRSGLKVLSAPLKPEQADIIEASHIKNIISVLRSQFDLIVVDTAQNFTDVTLTALDESDLILLVSTLDLPTLKNVMLSNDVMRSLNYPPEKIRLVVNRDNSKIGLDAGLLEKKLNMPVSYSIPSDGKLVVESLNQGVPFVLSAPKSAISQSIRNMAVDIGGIQKQQAKKQRRPAWLGLLKLVHQGNR